MKPRARAFVGAATGAVLMLVAHPSTRPGVLAAFLPLPQGGLAKLIQRPDLAPPTDLDSAAAYLHEGAERLRVGKVLAADERKTLLDLAHQGEIKEPENPFWSLSSYVLQEGRGDKARADFRRASHGRRYFDHQRAIVERDLRRISADGPIRAWAYAAVAPGRSSAMVEVIRDTALRTLRGVHNESERAELAFETISIGAMVRDGSERLGLGFVGVDMIEGATYPSATVKGSLIRRLWIAKTTLTGTLRAEGRGTDALFCDTQFRKDDSWQAFRDVEDPDGRLRVLSIGAAFVDAAPGALLAAAIAGAFVCLFAQRLDRLASRSNHYRGWGLAFCCFALLVLGTLLGYPAIAFMAGACVLVPSLGPSRFRAYGQEPLGPLHVLVVALMVFGLGGGLTMATLARSLPGQVLDRQGDIGTILGDAPRWGAAALVVLGASALAPPAWAVVRRFPTPAVAAKTYRDLGRGLASGALVLAILAAPACLVLDRWLGNSLAEIVQNEQIAYSPSNMVER